jgi:hypothetical protein
VGERVAGSGHDEEEDTFVAVLRAAAADAERVAEVGVERRGFDDGVDFAAAEVDAGGVFFNSMSAVVLSKILQRSAKQFTYSKHHHCGHAW